MAAKTATANKVQMVRANEVIESPCLRPYGGADEFATGCRSEGHQEPAHQRLDHADALSALSIRLNEARATCRQGSCDGVQISRDHGAWPV